MKEYLKLIHVDGVISVGLMIVLILNICIGTDIQLSQNIAMGLIGFLGGKIKNNL